MSAGFPGIFQVKLDFYNERTFDFQEKVEK